MINNLTTLHRFTPPTCSLEIKGKKSPLSRWTEADLLKNFKFKLSFDDPRLSSDKQATITGDRIDLEQLKNSVDKYIQQSLYSSLLLEENAEDRASSINNQPYLKSKGLTNHELFLGNLKHDRTSSKIILSTVQLFDLVTALEAYSSQIKALPELKRSQTEKAILVWGGIAAVVLAGVGIAAILLKSSPMQNIASSPEVKPSDTVPQFDDIVAPEALPTSKKKTPQPKINESISSAKKLPPPPAVSTPKSKPDIPDPADYSLSQVARQSGFKQPAKKEQVKEEQVESTILPSSPNIPQANSPSELKTNSELDSPKVKPENYSAKLDRANIDNNIASKNTITKPNQSQQIQAYFKNKWQPPADLNQSLEYRLYLNPNGSIKRVVPIGKASQLYLERTNIPVNGETFISPLDESQKSTIRLLLNPDGGIQTFAE